MRKLTGVLMALCIFTAFVSGASAAPCKGDNGSVRGSISLSEYANAYATGSPNNPSYAFASAYTQVDTSPNGGLTAIGVTQAYASGSSACASSGQTLTGYITFK
jgi:hypothetical protein